MQDTYPLSESPTQAVVTTAIRVEMARQQLTQDRLARMAGMRQQQLSRRMSGRTPWDVADLDRLAAALGVTVSDLVAA